MIICLLNFTIILGQACTKYWIESVWSVFFAFVSIHVQNLFTVVDQLGGVGGRWDVADIYTLNIVSDLIAYMKCS